MSEDPTAQIKKFAITDMEGNPHQYTVLLFPPDEGETLMWQVTAMAGESLGAVIGAQMFGDEGDKIETSAIGRDIANAIRTTNMTQFRKALLRHVTRDGHSMDKPLHFNAAYQANYAELQKAMWEVLRVNNLFPRPDMLVS